jgi:adenosylcobyric acid synthase
MVLGTSSGAGKSWIATALCRHWANQGLKVAPFKAQNMSNNARVVAGATGQWGEIGAAQYFQALAARAVPEVRMNPLLLKPEADTHSQVVLFGQVDRALSALPWRERKAHVWPRVAEALDALRAEHDVVVIEGAGSPAEINLMASDVVNLRVARQADARCLLVADIDRGGAFAHLYGTWALLAPEDRARIHGFVLNKFRGDAGLLAPAPQRLEELTGVPTVAVVPMRFGHGLPEEDGRYGAGAHAGGAAVHTRVVIVAFPRISNLDEFQPLEQVPGLRLAWAREPADLDGADWIVLPGSKATLADLAWLRAQGLDVAVTRHAARGGRVLGVCGGLQILGRLIDDPAGVETRGRGPGLGLLPLVTVFGPDKTVRPANVRFGALAGAWQALSGVPCAGYEIHAGRTRAEGDGAHAREVIAGLAWQNAAGNVLGLALHGLFEQDAVLQALFGVAAPSLDAAFERLAATLASAFAPGVLDALIAR